MTNEALSQHEEGIAVDTCSGGTGPDAPWTELEFQPESRCMCGTGRHPDPIPDLTTSAFSFVNGNESAWPHICEYLQDNCVK